VWGEYFTDAAESFSAVFLRLDIRCFLIPSRFRFVVRFPMLDWGRFFCVSLALDQLGFFLWKVPRLDHVGQILCQRDVCAFWVNGISHSPVIRSNVLWPFLAENALYFDQFAEMGHVQFAVCVGSKAHVDQVRDNAISESLSGFKL
jgi:hypothetical protein